MELENKINLSNLPKNLINIFLVTAKGIGIDRIAIVGGGVRDGMISQHFDHKPHSLRDLDLVLEGSASELAKELQHKLGSERVTILRNNSAYETVTLEIDKIQVDIASAREETYISPGENPIIQSTILEKDLNRRDFTINAIALDLASNQLIDLHQGRDAIRERQLTFLHRKSVEEDPTRIVRGARYAARLNFNLTKESLDQIQSTINCWPWEWKLNEANNNIPPALGTRLRMELELVFTKEPWEQAISYLQSWGALRLLDQSLQSDRGWNKRIFSAYQLGLNPLTALVAGSNDPLNLAQRLQLPIRQQNLLGMSNEIKKLFTAISSTKEYINWSPSEWCQVIENSHWQQDSISLAICVGVPLKDYLIKWLTDWQSIKSPVSAKELIEQGWKPGPELRKELVRLRAEKLNKSN